jgi:FtsZ-interacting cell division protein ZipA
VTTEQIIWTVVIVVAALALIGFIVASMRKRSQEDNRARATELREQAEAKAAVIPDAQARAQEAEAKAEQARLQAERAEQRAQEARAETAQREALHEDQIRAADRLDPDVDHKAKDYTPDTAAVSGTHAAERSEHETADPHPSGASVGTHAAEPASSSATDTRAPDGHSDTRDPETIFDSRESDTTSTGADASGTAEQGTDGTDTTTWSGNPTTAGSHSDPDAPAEPDWTDPDQRDGTAGGTTGGSHRA